MPNKCIVLQQNCNAFNIFNFSFEALSGLKIFDSRRYYDTVKDFLRGHHRNTVFLVGGNDSDLFQVRNIEDGRYQDPQLGEKQG